MHQLSCKAFQQILGLGFKTKLLLQCSQTGDHTVTCCRTTCVLLRGFYSFQHNHCQAVKLQCAVHSRDRLFAVWRRTVRSKVADWMHGPCLASTRRRLHLKGWVSEHQWHQQYQTCRRGFCKEVAMALMAISACVRCIWTVCTEKLQCASGSVNAQCHQVHLEATNSAQPLAVCVCCQQIACSEVSSISDTQHAMCTALLFWQLARDIILGFDILMAVKMSLTSILTG